MDTVFERMMFGNLSTTSSFEATEREYEVEVYVEGLDIDAIDSSKLSKELQEQWSVYIPKGPENITDGRIRVRKSVKMERQYEWDPKVVDHYLTIKTNDRDGGDLESEIEIEKLVFDQFTELANQGMVKTRYFFPFEYEGLEFVAEVDTFKNDQGEYIPWVKIDIEYPEGYDYSTHPLTHDVLPSILQPASPDKVHVVSPEDPKDVPVRKKVKEIYDRYFLKPNKHLDTEAIDND